MNLFHWTKDSTLEESFSIRKKMENAVRKKGLSLKQDR